MIWVGAAIAGDVPCADVLPALEAAETALVGLDLEAAEDGLKDAESVFLACRAVVDPSTLGRLWFIEGVLRSVQRDADSARDAFQASARVYPTGFGEAFGPAVKAQYEASASAEPIAASLRLLPDLGGNRAFVDGTEHSEMPLQLAEGLHALQITDPTRVVLFSRMVFVPGDEQMRLDTGVPTARVVTRETPQPVEPVQVAPPERRRGRGLLWAGVGTAVVGAGLFAVSFERSASMSDVEDAAILRSRYHQHVGTRASGLGLLGVGAGLIGVSTVF